LTLEIFIANAIIQDGEALLQLGDLRAKARSLGLRSGSHAGIATRGLSRTPTVSDV
jgi:hypothetical protein